MQQAHVASNAGELERLRSIVSQATEHDLGQALSNGWTISATLAHLAFWDRLVLARWEDAEKRGDLLPPVLDDAVQDLVNAAAIHQWRLLPARIAGLEAIRAAEAVDAFLVRLTPAALSVAIVASRPALIDRSIHRREHLDEIGRLLEAGRGARPGL